MSVLTLSWRKPLSYRNQSIDLLYKSIDWFLCDNGPRHERVKTKVAHNKLTYTITILNRLHPTTPLPPHPISSIKQSDINNPLITNAIMNIFEFKATLTEIMYLH